MADKPTIVIGAGIVGMSAAIWLRRAGKEVIVLDKGAPGMGTSYGNGGILAACSVAPVTAPGLVMKGPKMLMDPNFPLFVRWPYLPKLAPWLIKYLSHANDKDTRRISRGLADITSDTKDQHRSLVKGTTAEDWITDSEYGFAYTDRAAFDADAYTWELRREAGFTPDVITGQDVHDYEPNFNSNIQCLALMKDHAYVRAPGKYVQALAEVFQAEGGTLRQAEVTDITLTDGRITEVITKQGPIACGAAVLATGVWSKELSKKLGLNVPLESERGYHIMFKDPSFTLKSCLMIAGGKFVATPMEDGLRCAGVVEFGGLNDTPSKAPLALLKKKVMETFPGLQFSDTEEWLGHRPATSDSLPLIGEINNSGVFAGFGHHHIGLTGGPKTGRLIADLITRNGTNLDLSAFDPSRFN
ncbi:NAD(P)/FAD-dependent oxidoreductase [Cochlodiniinecator piscidefendens]|uniref:NAD(P)/FAD-dependent oxidoreductase n=1 Tax=Cochlodiniinecator piscidefendens TaxID=2715756 RepID=UPI00140E5C56|nr:FAD-binding oxidoreductase [Cochlodiniinecator piscidefendens]